MTDAGEGPRRATARSQQKAATRARMVEAASRLFAERDYEHVAVADIARDAGVAHGLVFHHFGSKEGVYRAVLESVVAEMDAAFVVPSGLGGPSLVRAALETHLTYLATHRQVALRLVLGRASTDATAADVFGAGKVRALTALAALLGLDPAHPLVAQVGSSVVAAYDEASRQWLLSADPAPVDALVTYVIELGIGAVIGARSLPGCPDVSEPLSILRAAAQGEPPHSDI